MKNKIHFLLFDRRGGAVVSAATTLHNNTTYLSTRTAFSHLPKYYIIIHCNYTTAVHHIFFYFSATYYTEITPVELDFISTVSRLIIIVII